MSEIIHNQDPLPVVSTPAQLLQVAIQSGADLDRLEKLMDMQLKWEANEARKEFAKAMAEFRGQVPLLKKDQHVKFSARNGGATTDYRHTSYGHMVETVNPILARCGLTFKHDVSQGDTINITCTVTHYTGHFESVSMHGPADASGNKNPIQAVKSTVSLLKRATLEAALGLASEDDDGHSATVENMDDFITDEQVIGINEIIDSSKQDDIRTRLMGWLSDNGVESIETIPAKHHKSYLATIKEAAL